MDVWKGGPSPCDGEIQEKKPVKVTVSVWCVLCQRYLPHSSLGFIRLVNLDHRFRGEM